MAHPTLERAGQTFFDIHELQIAEITIQQLPHLLKYEDRNSMANSIESRVPYVEVDCVETSFRIPTESKIRNGYTKFPLRRIAEKILPATIAWRRNKYGFEAPTALWLKTHKPLMAGEIVDSKILKTICQSMPDLAKLGLEMQWRLYNTALWERLFHVES